MQLQSCIRNTGFPGTLRAKGSKLAGDNVAHDVNYEKSKENQDSIEEVSQEGNIITVKVDVDSLNEFTSTDPQQGDGKWICLVIDTGTDDITKVKYNNYALTQADVEEAASVGVGAGKFVLWLKAEVVEQTPKQFTLSANGQTDVTTTIQIGAVG